jgi:hypothetical protein
MKFRRKDPSKILWKKTALLFLCCNTALVWAGSFQDSLFRQGVGTNLIVSDSLSLDIHYHDSMRMEYGLGRPANSLTSKTPDVVAMGNQRFRFFWSDSQSANLKKFNYTDLFVVDTGIVTGNVGIIDTMSNLPGYLHATLADTNFFISTVDNINTLNGYGKFGQKTFHIIGMDGTNAYKGAASQCFIKKDTFFIIYEKSHNIYGRKALFQSNKLMVDTGSAIFPIAPLGNCSNPSIATDRAGNFLALWGQSHDPALLAYALFTSSYTMLMGPATFPAPDILPAFQKNNRYDVARTLSYGPGKFVAANGEDNGIKLHFFKNTDTPVPVSITSLPGNHFPSISANSNEIAIAWLETQPAAAPAIKVVKYPIDQGDIKINAASPVITLPFNDAVSQDTNIVVNSAIDSVGNIGIGIQMNSAAKIGVITSRNILYDTGSWVSDTLLIKAGLDDSVYFDTLSVSTALPQDTSLVRGFIGVGASKTIGNFATATNGATLKNSTKGVYTNFLYKIQLHHDALNLVRTPVVKKAYAHWNAKPKILPIDSVLIDKTWVDTVKFGDMLYCLSRFDSVTCRFKMFDPDSTDILVPEIEWQNQLKSDSIKTIGFRAFSIRIPPDSNSNEVIAYRFGGKDKNQWAASDRVLYIKTRNVPPDLRVRAVVNGSSKDTTDITSSTPISLQQNGRIEFFYSMTDSNDIHSKTNVSLNGGLIKSTSQNIVDTYIYTCNPDRPQIDSIEFRAADRDSTVIKKAVCGINHFPTMDSVYVGGKKADGGDTISVTPGLASQITAYARDADVGFGDILTYHYYRGHNDTLSQNASFVYFPDRSDTSVTVSVFDKLKMGDSLKFFIKFPWYENNPAHNQDLLAAQKSLGRVSQIIGSAIFDSIVVPIKNSGNDVLIIDSVKFNGAASHWLELAFMQNGTLQVFDSLAHNTIIPIHCPPDSTTIIRAFFSSTQLSGDGLLYDTIFFRTNDKRQPLDTLPIRFEYNDLPRITACSVSVTQDKPFWLAKRKKKAAQASQSFPFPAYSSISITFSEPMDSASALNAITIFSVFDSIALADSPGVSPIRPIPLTFRWSKGKTQVNLFPAYSQTSPYFKFKPMTGLFIPTDSLRLKVSSDLTDIATTPSGRNPLDVHRNSNRSAHSDTTFSFRVDRSTFTLSSVSPDSAATMVTSRTSITLTFSSVPFPGTLDTAKLSNKMLIIHSAWGGEAQINFSRIQQTDTSITFFPSKRFFSGDTVRCRYRGTWARDSLGYSADINKDGVPASMFDSTSLQDDKEWFFIIKGIMRGDVSPSPGAVNVATGTAIGISFSDTVNTSTVDTSRRNNRTLTVTSRCSRGEKINFDSISVKGTGAVFYPSHPLYYGDSLFCAFHGLSTLDTSGYSVAGRRVDPVFTKDSLLWTFCIKPISCLSVLPETSSSTSAIHPEVVLQFSDPVFKGTFDGDTSPANRSFRLSSPYRKDSAYSYKSIVYSADLSRITLRPNATFFSNDSLTCSFAGFLRDFSYDSAFNLPGGGPTVAGLDWHFFIRNEKFYTYPNPYKPGIDPRHCGASGPCGIWFKNLHVLKEGVSEVAITIFSIYAHPIFSTKTAGITIKFKAGNADMKPQWKWDTRNQRGDLVASGLYLYAIYDGNGKVLLKDKLMIVR